MCQVATHLALKTGYTPALIAVWKTYAAKPRRPKHQSRSRRTCARLAAADPVPCCCC